MLKNECIELVNQGIKTAADKGLTGDLDKNSIPEFSLEVPKNPEFGDAAVNVSKLCRFTKKSPVDTAKIIVKYMADDEISDSEGFNFDKRNLDKFEVTVVGGYINFKFKQDALNSSLEDIIVSILKNKENFGKNNTGNGEKVLLEYVSANPTGPFHIGHGRWAAMGSTLANVMKFSGYDVFQEFYVNDAGNQINKLGKSLYIRIMQELGKDIDFPHDEEEAKGYYTGEYLIECAKDFILQNPDKAKEMAEKNLSEADIETHKEIAQFGKIYMLGKQKALLEKFRTHFDNFYFETSLHQRGDVQKCLDTLTEKGYMYEKDGAIYFKSSVFGDDEDRVIKKTDGTYTYLTADIAYHCDKLKRGFNRLINIWGADHHGYIPRMRASIEALGYNPDSLVVLLGQLVNLSVNGEQVRMGKRSKMITLDELIDDVGVDATRYWMIMRDIDVALDFDIELAKSKTDENPVFYVQYAHARACSILRNAVAERQDTVNKNVIPPMFEKTELDNFFENISKDKLDILWKNNDEAEEIKKLIQKLDEYRSIVINAAKNLTPYIITRYIKELAAVFHKFYGSTRILSDNIELSKAKLAIIKAVVCVLKSALDIIGADAPEKM